VLAKPNPLKWVVLVAAFLGMAMLGLLLVNAGFADQQGAYRVENVARGFAYPTIAVAVGYEPIFFADMVIDDAFPADARMNAIYLQRQ